MSSISDPARRPALQRRLAQGRCLFVAASGLVEATGIRYASGSWDCTQRFFLSSFPQCGLAQFSLRQLSLVNGSL